MRQKLKQTETYLNELNTAKLEDITFIDYDGSRVNLDKKLISEWIFQGLNNRDFFRMYYGD